MTESANLKTEMNRIYSFWKTEKRLKQSLRILWDNIKRPNTCEIEVLKRDERVWYRKKYLKEKMTESSPNLTKDKLRNPTNSAWKRKNLKKPMCRYSVIKLLKTREKGKKKSWKQLEKNDALQGNNDWNDFGETMNPRREWNNTSQCWNQNSIYGKISFKNEDENKDILS